MRSMTDLARTSWIEATAAIPSPRRGDTLVLPPDFLAKTDLERHIEALERAERRLRARVHALGRHGDPDLVREVLTRLRHVRARLTEARSELARTRS